MSKQVTDREILQELAERPIGGPECKIEFIGGELRPNWEAKEASERARKVWLPAGKKTISRKDAAERAEAFYANQIDLEDAVTAAGGERGSLRAA